MTGFLTFLLILALLVVVLEYTNRRRSLFVGPTGGQSDDRDRQRISADLRAAKRD